MCADVLSSSGPRIRGVGNGTAFYLSEPRTLSIRFDAGRRHGFCEKSHRRACRRHTVRVSCLPYARTRTHVSCVPRNMGSYRSAACGRRHPIVVADSSWHAPDAHPACTFLRNDTHHFSGIDAYADRLCDHPPGGSELVWNPQDAITAVAAIYLMLTPSVNAARMSSSFGGVLTSLNRASRA